VAVVPPEFLPEDYDHKMAHALGAARRLRRGEQMARGKVVYLNDSPALRQLREAKRKGNRRSS
jgi:hypothetical protein